MTNASPNLKYVEDEKFSQNASEALLEREQLVDFLASLSYAVEPSGKGYKGLCPECRSSAAYIGTGGKYHKIWWKCYDRRCPSNNRQSKLVRNLLGLVRGQVEGRSLALAMKKIADFLGAKSTWDVTNNKLVKTYYFIFLTDTQERQSRLEKAGVEAIFFQGDYTDERLRRELIVVTMDQDADRVATAIRNGKNRVDVIRPIHFFSEEPNKGGYESGLRRKAIAAIDHMIHQAQLEKSASRITGKPYPPEPDESRNRSRPGPAETAPTTAEQMPTPTPPPASPPRVESAYEAIVMLPTWGQMTAEYVRRLLVAEAAGENAVLWLWSSNADLPAAFDVVRHWGFEHKTLLTCPGRDARGPLVDRSWYCIVATRGTPAWGPVNQQALISRAGALGVLYPEGLNVFWEMVEASCPGRKAVAFSPTPRDGWTVLQGTEVEEILA
jgi:N6-adenosine-specific RNA methylase IME4